MAEELVEEIPREQLQRWKLIPPFLKALEDEKRRLGGAGATWENKRRKLHLGEYLGLYLFGLFNPVFRTMRSLCENSAMAPMDEVCGRPVSLGSFSEAQALVNPELLKAVFAALVRKERAGAAALAGIRGGELLAMDSTVWRVLARMSWAFWRGKINARGGADNAVRMQLYFDLKRGGTREAQVSEARICERALWEKAARKGACYIGDCNYGRDYKLLERLQKRGVNFVVRLAGNARWKVVSQESLSEADRRERVKWAGTVRLGTKGGGPQVRVVRIQGEKEQVTLCINLTAREAPPELLSQIYRYRWKVELFFRWIKCILGCRHWLAESPRGVAVQIYLALIAAELLVLYNGQRPNKRQMEIIQAYVLGWASPEEAATLIMRNAKRKRKTA